MVTTRESTRQVPRIAAGSASGFTVSADINAIADDLRDKTNTAVAAFVNLPTTLNWPDRIVKVTATATEYRWTGTAWKPHNSDWIVWTPSLTAGSGSFVQGNGTLTARYRWVDGDVSWLFRLLLGTTSTIGTNSAFSLPITAEAAISAFSVQGRGTLGVTNGSQIMDGVCYRNGASQSTVVVGAWVSSASFSSVQGIGAAVPFGWGAGCYIELAGTYMPA